MENLFAKIKAEQSGKLDVLVNNAYAGVDMIFKVCTFFGLKNSLDTWFFIIVEILFYL